MEGSGPTIAGGERSEPPVQSAGREPGEMMTLFMLIVEAEGASGSGRGAVAGAGAAVPKERAVGRGTMPAPRQPGPSTRVQCTLQDGQAAGPGPVVRRRFPLGGAGGAVRGAQIARAARAPLPFGDSLKKGGARGGVSRGEGRGGGNGGQGVLARVCVRGPASIELRCQLLGARRRSVHDRHAGARELPSPLSRMQRPCRGVRCEHKLTVAVSPMALASEAPRHGSVFRVPPLFPMESCARATGLGRRSRR